MSKWTDERDAFWAKVKGLWTSLSGRLEVLFNASATAVATAVEAQEPQIKGDVTDFLDKAAHDAVTAAEKAGQDDPTLKGQAKMAVALDEFWSILKTVGLTLGETLARSLLQNALIALKLAL